MLSADLFATCWNRTIPKSRHEAEPRRGVGGAVRAGGDVDDNSCHLSLRRTVARTASWSQRMNETGGEQSK